LPVSTIGAAFFSAGAASFLAASFLGASFFFSYFGLSAFLISPPFLLSSFLPPAGASSFFGASGFFGAFAITISKFGVICLEQKCSLPNAFTKCVVSRLRVTNLVRFGKEASLVF
jgi:hypothetical protein